MNFKNWLVIGGDSLIGNAIWESLVASNAQVSRTSRRRATSSDWINFDLLDHIDSLNKEITEQPQVILLCAAATGFAKCEEDPYGTGYINVTRTLELATYFLKLGKFIVYFSSNAVFDGSKCKLDEDTAVSPVSEYGRQKVACEKELLSASAVLPGDAAVIRLTKVVDPSRSPFSEWIANLNSGKTVKAARDLVISPITTKFVANCVKRIVESKRGGLYHVSGKEDVTYFELVKLMSELYNKSSAVDSELIKYSLGAIPMPVHSALSMRRSNEVCGLEPQLLNDVARELLYKG